MLFKIDIKKENIINKSSVIDTYYVSINVLNTINTLYYKNPIITIIS